MGLQDLKYMKNLSQKLEIYQILKMYKHQTKEKYMNRMKITFKNKRECNNKIKIKKI